MAEQEKRVVERVALVMGPAIGGLGRHVQSLVQGLVQRGLAVDVYCPAAAETQFDFTEAGATVVAVDVSASVGAVASLRRALRAQPPDVIHAHGLRPGFVASVARPGGVGLVVTWHNPVPTHGVGGVAHRALARAVAGAAEITLCASEDLVEAATRLGAKDARLAMVVAPELAPPTRDQAEVRADIGLPDEAPMVLAVGRLDPRHRHDVIVAAAARWRHRTPVPYVVIGGTGPSYRDLVAQTVLARSPVIFVGQRADVADLLGAADIAVITSESQARPMFAQEALRAGVALVTTDVGGSLELVGDAALLVPPGDVDAVDAAVRGLLDDPATSGRYAAAGPGRAAKWPTEAETVDEVAAVYAEVRARVLARAAARAAEPERDAPHEER